MTLVVAGSSAQAAVGAVGVEVTKKGAAQLLKRLPISVLREVNKKVGFYLVAKYGTKRATLTLSKAIPGVGALTGGAIDAGFTKAMGRQSVKAFPVDETGFEDPA